MFGLFSEIHFVYDEISYVRDNFPVEFYFFFFCSRLHSVAAESLCMRDLFVFATCYHYNGGDKLWADDILYERKKNRFCSELGIQY